MRQTFTDVLARSGLVPPEVLRSAIAQSEQGTHLLDILIKEKLISSEKLLALQASFLGIPYLETLENLPFTKETLELIPEKLARQKRVIPLKREGSYLTLIMSNLLDYTTLQEIENTTHLKVNPILAPETEIAATLDQLYSGDRSMQEIYRAIGEAPEDSEESIEVLEDVTEDEMTKGTLREDDAPIIRFVNVMISRALRERASDIHIEPDEDRLLIRYRVDGFLREIMTPPKRLHMPIVSRVKVMADLDIAQRRLPQDGHIRLKMNERRIEIRVSTIPGIFGEKVVMRLLDPALVLLSLDKLGFQPSLLEEYKMAIIRPFGIILVTGPTGSGKTTTLYSTINQINTVEKNICTIEDPVEYHLPRINQIQVNPKAGITFASGLRSILRQDPNVIMVGEMRDIETCQIAIRSALTGHLVLSTLHTNDAPGAITRLIDMEIPPYLIASCLIGTLAQRLVRTICPRCKIRDDPSPELLRRFRWPRPTQTGYRGKGCDACHNTGYMGRTCIAEFLPVQDYLRELIVNKASTDVITKAALRRGFVPMIEDGIKKVTEGITTVDEVVRVTDIAEG
jgi:type IV pilus assembly protein PilB